MALTSLPKLPEGIHAFYAIFKKEEKNYTPHKITIYIVSADIPLLSTRDGDITTKTASNPLKTFHYFSNKKQEWVEWETSNNIAYITGDYHYTSTECIYTNNDIRSVYRGKIGDVVYKKSIDATEIIVDGGDIRNMQKGMVWNVGESISINPPEAPQICTFSSSNPDVCTVDETGKIVAVGEGECVITITSKM